MENGAKIGAVAQMEEEKCQPDMVTLVKKFAGKDLPIAVTRDIGHGTDAKGIWIGREFAAE
ncbi:MAG: hypothetical protein HDR24_05035 [Lachnospiraceae bacterium]|nr:hypothetical protein [Lachnospiraceae bacterium]